ncbi:MAG: hypothetical protein ACJAVV_000761 [Alphaproteobacteria bacterium]|jgi:hypothetical protein
MTKIPAWFYVLASVALLWNLLGGAAVIMNFIITTEAIASLPPEQQQMYADTPMWSSYGSLLAVITGSFGCLALLIKKAWAYPLFMLSIVGLVLQNIGIFLVVNAVAVLGETVLFMQAVVAVIAIGLLLLAKKAIKKAWIL